jgi:hypothetical protein
VESELMQVQRFERARFEWHPDNPADFRVLLGRLGATLLNGQTAPEQPPEVNQVLLYFVALDDEGASESDRGQMVATVSPRKEILCASHSRRKVGCWRRKISAGTRTRLC